MLSNTSGLEYNLQFSALNCMPNTCVIREYGLFVHSQEKSASPHCVKDHDFFYVFFFQNQFFCCKCWVIYPVFVESTVVSEGLCKIRLFKMEAFLVIYEKCLNFFGLIAVRK